MKDLPGPGQCEWSIFLPISALCITRLCDNDVSDDVQMLVCVRKKERLFSCSTERPAKGRRGVFARMEGVPWCHVVDDTAAGSRHKL